MAFIYNVGWNSRTGKSFGLQYYGEIKHISPDGVISFVCDDNLLFSFMASVIIVCPD